MPFSKIAGFGVVKTLAFGGISATYAAVGTPLSQAVRAITFINGTAGTMAFTITNGSTPASDGTADEVILFTLSARTYDISTNSSHFTSDAPFILPKGSQVWVRQITAPTSGSVFIEYLIGVGD